MNESAGAVPGVVAVVIAADFEDSELTVPVQRLEAAGYRCELVGVRAGQPLEGKRGLTVVTDKGVAECSVADYRALVIPGGYSPDRLRKAPEVVALVRDFMAADKPVAAICHGPRLLIEADVVRDRRLTSWPSVRTDLIAAGARWEDSVVVEDGGLISSRKPADLDVFCETLLHSLGRQGQP